jgi:hypothetical protein
LWRRPRKEKEEEEEEEEYCIEVRLCYVMDWKTILLILLPLTVTANFTKQRLVEVTYSPGFTYKYCPPKI